MKSPEHREVEPQVYSLRKAFLDATFAPNRNIDPSIRKIDLGTFADEANNLRNITASDPKQREVAKRILTKNDKFPLMGQPNVVIEREPRIGDESNIFPSLFELEGIGDPEKRRFLLKSQRQDKFIAAMLHTHPNEMPPSQGDISHILLDDIEYVYANTCTFVATPQLNYLVFRGKQTPSLKEKDISVALQTWRGKIQEGIRSKLDEEIEKKSGKLYATRKELFGLEAVVQQKVFNENIHDYGLIAFTGRADSRTVSRVTV